MSTFAVRLVEVIGLRGRYDRIAKLIFRGKRGWVQHAHSNRSRMEGRDSIQNKNIAPF